MALSEREIRSIVDRISDELERGRVRGPSRPPAPSRSAQPQPTPDLSPAGSARGRTGTSLGIFETVDQAVEAARRAQREIRTLKLRDKIIANQRKRLHETARTLAEEAVRETGLGNVRDKTLKNELCIDKTPGTEDLHPEILSGDHGLTLTELAPWGVIGAVTPSTNPGATIINNGISMVASGNTVVFAAHPMAKGVTNHAIHIMNQASAEVGGPETLLTAVAEPTIETAQTLFHHKGIDLLVVTGGGAVVREAQKSSKRVIAAGPGNPPVVVDRSADLAQAGRDIVAGASFDNNIVCTCEKEILAEAGIADELLQEMERNHAVRLTREEGEALARAILLDYPGPSPRMNRDFIGRDAAVLAAAIGKKVPGDTRLLVAEAERDHPFAVLECLSPIIPLIRCPDVGTAITWAVELEHGFK